MKGSKLLQNSKGEVHIDNKQDLQAIMGAMNHASIIAITNKNGVITYVNNRFCDISKYDKSELIGGNHSIIKSGYHPDDFFKKMWSSILSGQIWKGEIKNRAKDGSFYWVDTTIVPFLNKEKEPYMFISIRNDITDKKIIEMERNKTSNHLLRAQELARIGSWEYELKSRNLYCTKGIYDILGYKREELEINFRNFIEFIHVDDRETVWSHLKDIQKGKTFEMEYRVITKDRSVKVINQTVNHYKHAESGQLHILGTVQDITQQKQLLKEIHFLAYHDYMTGLLNRRSFEDHLKVELSKEEDLTIMFVDINRFKFINDAYGFSAGDTVIKEAAERLKACVKNDGVISRLSGDDFGIILLNKANVGKVEVIAKELVDSFNEPIKVNDVLELTVSISIGINHCQATLSKDLETVLKKANVAMNFAKSNTKEKFCYYNSFLDKITKKTTNLEIDLKHAMERNELYLCYQPKIHLSNFKISGLEGLIRWNHPTYGHISPGEFVPLAEKTKLIIPIGEWILQEGCRQAREWIDKGIKFNRIALNVSLIQFYHSNFIQSVKDALHKYNLNADYLELEITESVMNNIDKSLEIITELKHMGVKVTLDDFGTGFSSLNVLNKLAFDCLKIDRSFVHQMLSDKKTKILTNMIIQMGRELEMELVAEGVETREQLTHLKDNFCNVGQGYYFSKPLKPNDMEKYLHLL